ncbi:hypothetical protein BH23DEI1_BH23DEI1_20240 [soil metagenome]
MSTQHYRLLLVEDDPTDARLFGMMLDELHVPADSVRLVGSVEAALVVLAHAEIDLVFLDLDLPDSGGIATVERVLSAADDVAVIVLTGYRDEELGVRAVSLGAQDYLVKDTINANVLQRVLRYAVGRQRALSLAKRESARAASTDAHEAAMDAAEHRLEHEVAVRRSAQDRLEVSLARLRALRGIDAAIVADLPLEQLLEAVLDALVPFIPVDAASFSLLRGGSFVPVASRGLAADDLRRGPLSQADPAARGAVDGGQVTLELAPEGGADLDFARREVMRAVGAVSYHAIALKVREEPVGLLELYASTPPESGRLDWLEFVGTQCALAASAIDARRLRSRLMSANDELLHAYDATIAGWSRALDLRDHETKEHSARVATATLDLARRLGVHEDDALNDLRRGALLHDIGKIAVPDAILGKRAPLTPEEHSTMQRHTEFARDLLEPIAYLRSALDIPYAHHERWDGSGYPRGIGGTEIPFAARIFAVVDVYDALTTDRPYRRAWDDERARRFIAEGAGRLFDPHVVDAFLAP